MSRVAKSFICRGCLNQVTSAGRTSIDIGASAKLERKCSGTSVSRDENGQVDVD